MPLSLQVPLLCLCPLPICLLPQAAFLLLLSLLPKTTSPACLPTLLDSAPSGLPFRAQAWPCPFLGTLQGSLSSSSLFLEQLLGQDPTSRTSLQAWLCLLRGLWSGRMGTHTSYHLPALL